MWNFQFFIWLNSLLDEVHFAENPTLSWKYFNGSTCTSRNIFKTYNNNCNIHHFEKKCVLSKKCVLLWISAEIWREINEGEEKIMKDETIMVEVVSSNSTNNIFLRKQNLGFIVIKYKRNKDKLKTWNGGERRINEEWRFYFTFYKVNKLKMGSIVLKRARVAWCASRDPLFFIFVSLGPLTLQI